MKLDLVNPLARILFASVLFALYVLITVLIVAPAYAAPATPHPACDGKSQDPQVDVSGGRIAFCIPHQGAADDQVYDDAERLTCEIREGSAVLMTVVSQVPGDRPGFDTPSGVFGERNVTARCRVQPRTGVHNGSDWGPEGPPVAARFPGAPAPSAPKPPLLQRS